MDFLKTEWEFEVKLPDDTPSELFITLDITLDTFYKVVNRIPNEDSSCDQHLEALFPIVKDWRGLTDNDGVVLCTEANKHKLFEVWFILEQITSTYMSCILGILKIHIIEKEALSFFDSVKKAFAC